MKEIEIKILNINPEEIRKKFESLNARMVKNEIQENFIYDTKESLLFNEKSYIRLRKVTDLLNKQDTYYFTYKKNITDTDYRINDEIEVKLDNIKNMEEILLKLGYELKNHGEKKRVSYMYRDILWEIDVWDKNFFPYAYLEAEMDRKTDISDILEELELKKNRVTIKSISELLDEIP